MTASVSQLGFVRRTHQLLGPRASRRWPADRARPAAEVLEPVADGVPLLDTVLARLPQFLLISPLHLDTGLLPFHVLAMLGRGPSDVHEHTPQGHIALLMCPHCVIGGCGVVSARVDRDERWTTWSEFGHGWPRLAGIGPFRFDTQQYEAVLESLLANNPPMTPTAADAPANESST